MDATVQAMEAQLAEWGLRIGRMTARTLEPGAQNGFETLMHIDVLKALHVIAKAKCDELRSAPEPERRRIKDELVVVWNELGTAIGQPRPSR